MSDLPPGWTNITLAGVGPLVGGKTPSKSCSAYWDRGTVPWTSPKDMKSFVLVKSEDMITPHAVNDAGMEVLPVDSVLMVTRSGILEHTFPVAITAMETSINQDIKALRPSQQILPRYAAYALRSFGQEILTQCSKEGTTVASVNTEALEKFPLPLAPRDEQKRIAAKLDAVLAKVDMCRARLDRVPEILKKFRAAVLEAAVSGRLTHKNTDSNGGSSELPSGWTSSAFSELISNIRTGTTAVPQDSPTKYPVLRSSSVRPLSVDLSDFRFLAKDQSANEDNFLAPGDLLFTRLSGSKEFVGNCAMVREVSAQRVQYPDRLFRARLKTPEAARYIEIAFASATVRKQVEAKVKSSAGHQRVSTDAITGALIPIPPKPIQESIVRIVDQLFAVADDLERRYKDSVLRVAKLTPSVLAKAFRGELVHQDPNDEPAGEMLERMLAQRTSPPK